MTAAVTRRVVIHDGILRHDPSKRTDCMSNTFGVRAHSLAERIERLSTASESFVQESVEVLLQDGVGGNGTNLRGATGIISVRKSLLENPARTVT